MARHTRSTETMHTLFGVTLLGKAIDGIFEILGGCALLFVNPKQINQLLWVLTQRELREDPNDVIAGFLLHSSQHLTTDTKLFAALFLLGHGIVKVGLVLALRRGQLWAYPTAIAAFGVFLVYQLYRYSHTHSGWLLALSVLDLCVILLTWIEYKRVKGPLAFPRVPSST